MGRYADTVPPAAHAARDEGPARAALGRRWVAPRPDRDAPGRNSRRRCLDCRH